MHELATHTHTYAHIIILLTCGCNFLEVRVSRAVHRARGGSDPPNALIYNLHGSAHAESHGQASIGGCHANGYDLCANG